ncbi:MAG TPA: MFS transporter [Acidimicrobiia bacterium]|nr:MFS transporter [Acidimicrobiia bacterium]
MTVGVFLPHSIVAIGLGATTPMIALLAVDLGASVPTAGLIVGLFGVGAFLADLPGGILASKLGDRRTMILATATMGLASLAVATRPSLLVFAALVAVMGASTALFALGRLTHATEMSPIGHRGRVMSTIGGTQRIGHLVGPALGGLTVVPFGLSGPFMVHALMAFAACAAVFVSPDSPGVRPLHIERPTLGRVFRDHRRTFATAGVAVVAIQIVRSSRQAVVPLWGSHVGLGPSQIALLFSLSAAMEVLMFYPVGKLMDRKGRKFAAIPSLVLMSLSMAAIPLTFSAFTLGAVVSVLGFANGMSTGINMTLSSDLSPSLGRSVFFGMWRMLTDVGTAGGPALVALGASIAGLGLAPPMVAAVGAGGALLLWRGVPETLERD